MALSNPYLDFFNALPPWCRADSAPGVSAAELGSPDWHALKNAIAGHFAWAVPTEAAIDCIARHAPAGVVEIGAGTGYWAWLLSERGLDVAAFDTAPPAFTWTRVEVGDERQAAAASAGALFLCWPPWAAPMASAALAAFPGETVIYVGEWMGGSAEPGFFARLASGFEAVDAVDIPCWHARSDRLWVFRRRRG
jgi:hypothetical protein